MTSKFVVAPGCEAVLQTNHQFLAYEAAHNRFYPSPQPDEERDVEVAEALKQTLLGLEKEGSDVTEEVQRLNFCAARFLEKQRDRFAELRTSLAACKDSPHLMNCVMIDRFVVANKYKQILATGKMGNETLPQIRSAFKTEAAREQLQKWTSERTHRAMEERARKHQKHPEFLDERVIAPLAGAKAFALHPQQVDFVRDHYLEKQVGTRAGHTIQVNEQTFDLEVMYDGEMRSVVDIANTHHSERHRLYTQAEHADERKRVFYKEGVGLTVCDGSTTEKEDPEQFEKTVPLFTKKDQRKHNDYRLEIWTVIKHEGDQHNHSWIGLKNPDGEVRRVGFFWAEGQENGWLSLLQPAPGDFHADGDRYDHMRLEAFSKRTSIQISQAQYDAAYNYVLTRQNQDPRVFGLINGNCTDFANGVLQAALGISAPVDCSLIQIYAGYDLANNFFVKYIPPLRLAVFALCAVLSIIRNLGMLALGATFWGDENTRTFKSFGDVFNPWSGRASHPIRMRQWQEKVERLREKEIRRVNEEFDLQEEMQPLELEKIRAAREQALYQAKTALPPAAIPQQQSIGWKLRDLLWSQSDEVSVIPVP